MAQILLPFQSLAAPVTVPAAAPTLDKYAILVEINWDTGLEGYSFESYRTPDLHYRDLVQSISEIRRSASPLGSPEFPKTNIRLFNRDSYFSEKWNATPHRGRTVRIKILSPLTSISAARTIFDGYISRAVLAGGIFSLEVIGNHFEQMFKSDLSQVLPVLAKDIFPNLPAGITPTIIPLIYGRVASPWGEDLLNPQVKGSLKAYLIDTVFTGTVGGWTAQTASAANTWKSVAFSPNVPFFENLQLKTRKLLVAVASSGTGNRVMTSEDGIVWTSRTSAADSNWTSVAYNDTVVAFVAVADSGTAANRIMWSGNGIEWNVRTAPTANDWKSVVYAKELGQMVAVASSGTGNRVMTSSNNGLSWVSQTSASDNNWTSVCWSKEQGLLVAVASSGTSRVMTSPNGTAWTSQTSADETAAWTSVCWSPDLSLFVAVASSGTDQVMTSPNGIDWTARTEAAAITWTSVAWSSSLDLFVAVADTGSGSRVMTSSNGTSWTAGTTTPVSAWSSVIWVQELGVFVAVGNTAANGVMLSPDGLAPLFRYAIGSGAVAGDPFRVEGGAEDYGDESELAFIFNYESRIGVTKSISRATFGNHELSYISFTVDQRMDNRGDEPEITFYGSGIRNVTTSDGIAGSGHITNPVTCKEHLLLNYGGFLVNQIDTPSQNTAKTNAVDYHFSDNETDGIAPAALGAIIADMHESISSIVQKFDQSFAMTTFQARNGQLGTITNTLGAAPSTTLSIDDETDILEGTFSVEDSENVATILHLKLAMRNEASDTDLNQNENFAQWCPNYPIFGAKQLLFPNQAADDIIYEINMPYNRRIGAAINAARAIAEILHPKVQWSSFELPISFYDDVDIGDYIGITHWQGISASGGYSNITARVFGVSIIPDPVAPRLQLTAMRRASGVAVQDNFNRTAASNSLGSSWTESENTATALQVANSSAIAGNTFNQLFSLLAVSGERGIAYWNVTTESNQIASIQWISRTPGVAMRCGIGVRMSGTHDNFTGYAAMLEEPTAGNYFVRLYRFQSQNISDGAGGVGGTQLASVTLVNADTDIATTSTWRNQGDILELRIEGSRLEVWFFSDIQANNKGRVIAITDTNIAAAGNMGIVSLNGGNAYLTNFYGRGF